MPGLYQEYLEFFRHNLELLGCKCGNITSYLHPLLGPYDESLYTEAALVGNVENARKALVIISGTHGVEGVSGAKLQIDLIKNFRRLALPDDVALLFVFALNPWGFAHGERTDENNVDLNRNAVELSENRVGRFGHEQIVDLVIPKIWDRESFHRLWTKAKKMGMESFQQALTGGQFEYKNSLFYGGKEEAWGVQTLRQICQDHLLIAEKVAIMDIHTGLGMCAKGDLFSPAIESGGELLKKTCEVFGFGVQFPNMGGSISSVVSGDILSAMIRWLPDADVLPVAVEMGVLSIYESLERLAASNWVRHHRDKAQPHFVKHTKQSLWEAFCPLYDEYWNGALWSKCLNAYECLIKWLQD